MKTKIIRDSIVDKVCKEFTYEFQEYIEFKEHDIIDQIPKDFNIGLILGTSGSGKSLLLKTFGSLKEASWDKHKAVCSHFDSYEEASEKLMAVGFNTIPEWLKNYYILSTGQRYRVDLARTLKDDSVFDEFTSVIDRGTALSLSNSVNKYIKSNDIKNVVFASVHKDIIEYLQPDWIYYTDEKELIINSNSYDLEINEKITYISKPYKKHFMTTSTTSS